MNGDDVQPKEALELRDYIRVIKERFWIIPIIVVIAVGATLALSFTSTPQYRSSARLLYRDSNLEQALFGSQVFSAIDEDREVRTGALLVELEPVAEAVKEQLESSKSVLDLLGMVDAEPQTSTNVVDIHAVGPDPYECAAVANAFADQFVIFRQSADRATVQAAREELNRKLKSMSRVELASETGLMLQDKYESLRIIEAMQDGRFTLVEQATPATVPFSPRPVRNGIIALVLGLVAGVGAAFLLDYLDRRVKDEKALEEELGAPVLTKVPRVNGAKRGSKNGEGLKEAVGFNKRPALLEAFRTLRSNLEFFSLDERESVWLITSCAPQEGKTTTAVNLALSLALSGKRVVVLEADLRRPMVHEYFGVEQTPGLSNVLAGTKRLEDVLQFIKADEFMPPESRRRPGEESSGLIQRNMYVVASGPIPPNPAELLSSSRMDQVVKDLAGMSDCLLIDTPPVLAVSDAVTIARHAGGVILVMRLGSTTRDQVREVRDIFQRAAIRVLGAVAIATKKSPAYKRRRGYGYGYGYGYEPAQSDLPSD